MVLTAGLVASVARLFNAIGDVVKGELKVAGYVAGGVIKGAEDDVLGGRRSAACSADN
jgi:hypothetical protein